MGKNLGVHFFVLTQQAYGSRTPRNHNTVFTNVAFITFVVLVETTLLFVPGLDFTHSVVFKDSIKNSTEKTKNLACFFGHS